MERDAVFTKVKVVCSFYMKKYFKPLVKFEEIEINDIILNSGVVNNGTLDSFDPDETWTIFDGGNE